MMLFVSILLFPFKVLGIIVLSALVICLHTISGVMNGIYATIEAYQMGFEIKRKKVDHDSDHQRPNRHFN